MGFSDNFLTEDFSLIQTAYGGLVDNTLSGFVIDKNLVTPISEAKVEIPALSIETTTDLLGFYRIDGLPLGPTTLFVSADGYVTKTEPPFDITEQWTKHDIELVGGGPGETAIILPEIFGTVYDINIGTRIPGATITVTGPTAVAPLTTSAQSPVDLGGDYRTGKLDSGSYDVTASITGYRPFTQTVSVQSGTPSSFSDAVADFYLKSFPYTVKGTVTGFIGGDDPDPLKNLEPLENIEIQSILKIGNEKEVYKRVLTDENGAYTFDDLPFGEWEFKAIAAVYETITETQNLLPSTMDPPADVIQDFEFLDRATVEVTVKSSAYGDMAISGMPVKLRNIQGIVDFGADILKTADTDASGKAKFENLPTGTYEIFVDGKHEKGTLFYPETKIVNDVFAKPSVPVIPKDIDLEPKKFTLSGTIKEKTGLTEIAKGRIIQSILFRGDQFPEGDNLSLTSPGVHTHFDHIALIQGGTIEGKLCLSFEFCYFDFPSHLREFGPSGADAYNLMNLQGATVKIIDLELFGQPVDSAIIDALQNSITDPSGNYFLDNLLPGFVGIEVAKPGYLPKKYFFTFPPPNDLMDPEICGPDPGNPICDPTFCDTHPNHPLCNGSGSVFSFDTSLRVFTENIFGSVHGVLVKGPTTEKRIKLQDATVTISPGPGAGSWAPIQATTNNVGMFELENIPLNFDSASYMAGETELRTLTLTNVKIKLEANGYTPLEVDGVIFTQEDFDTKKPGSLVVARPHGIYNFQDLLRLSSTAQINIDGFAQKTTRIDGDLVVTDFPNGEGFISRNDIEVINTVTGEGTDTTNDIDDISLPGFGFVSGLWNGWTGKENTPNILPLDLTLLPGSYEVIIPFIGPYKFNICKVVYNNLSGSNTISIDLDSFSPPDQNNFQTVSISISAPSADSAVCSGPNAPKDEFRGNVLVIDSITKKPLEDVTVEPFFISAGRQDLVLVDKKTDAQGVWVAKELLSGTTPNSFVTPEPQPLRCPFDDPCTEQFRDNYAVPSSFSADLSKDGYKKKFGVSIGPSSVKPRAGV